MGALPYTLDVSSCRIPRRIGSEALCAVTNRQAIPTTLFLRPGIRQLVYTKACESSEPTYNHRLGNSTVSATAGSLTPSSGCRPGSVACGLSRAWRALCSGMLVVLRLLAVVMTLCLASLAPRPAPLLAAQPPAACTTVSATYATQDAFTVEPSTHTSSDLSSHTDHRSSALSSHSGDTSAADVNEAGTTAGPASQLGPRRTTPASSSGPIADLAVASATAAGTGPSSSSSSSASGLSRSGTRSSIARSADAPSQQQDPATSSSGGSVPAAPVLTSSFAGGADGPAGSGGGPGAPTSSGGGAASQMEAMDPAVVALAQQWGLSMSEAEVVRLFERNRASVVNISGMRAMQTFTTLDLTKMPYGQGSGFIWGEKGHVVTCYHLVKGAAEVKVTLSDNTSYTAKVLGYDATKNLAVLKLSVPKSKLRELQPVTAGSAAGMRVGQTVFSISNPWGLGHTLSKGIVCGLGLELSAGLFPIKGVILTDTAPDPGSGGGVLLDSKGALVGMVVTPPSNGVCGNGGGRSFAVPIDAVRGLINQILAYGTTMRPALGITMAPAQVLERVGQDGVLVLEVPPGSPAHAAGLRHTHRDIFGDLVLGDIIIGLDGKSIRSSSDVYDILDEHRVGDRIKLDVLRDGKQTSLTVTLGERLRGAVEE